MRSNGNPADQSLTARVLIADDDTEFRGLLVRRAVKMGHSVLEVEDGLKAVEALEREPFDLLLTDLYMPGLTGLEVSERALVINPDLQVIILTGSASLETAVGALRAGVYDYLTKPLESLADFELTVNRALERRRLILENKRLFAEVQRLAVTDPLTGLFNRRRLDEALATEFERARRYARPLSMIMVDMDGLKEINDTFGHPAGDAALKLVAQAIRSQIRKVDLPARFGGDEFIILLPEVEQEVAIRIAERICSQLEPRDDQNDMFSISAGVSELRVEHASPEEFLRAVDQALYQAKHAGGNSVRAFMVDAESAEVEQVRQEKAS